MPEGPLNEAPRGMDRASAATPIRDPDPEATRRRRLRHALMAAGIVAAIGTAGWGWLSGGRYVSSDNAYVHADLLMVSTDVAGIVRDVPVHEGQQVHAGEVLYSLDPRPFEIAVAGAEARLRQAVLSATALREDLTRMQRDIAAQEAAVDLARAQFERAQSLVNTSAVSRASYDDSRFGLQRAEQQLASLRQQAVVQLARLGGDPDLPVERQPEVMQAQAALDEARRQLANSTVRAPFDGVVTRVEAVQPGLYLAAATPALGLVGSARAWIEVNPKETDLTYVRPGNDVTFTVDAYPGRTWHGHVQSIAPATGAQFSVLPAQNTSGNWVKVVQRVPVRVQVDAAEGAPPLRAGMSVVATIDTGHRRSLSDLF
ncbi:HlyD family secretion protein [Neoroseomonas oryzicola]|uniref:HlyD family secretion protein n=1 Tax=Neoroseomonas oryzicola TaxID=535904 RepID=A0ABX1EQJ8_9PROT|nr:HlyD family secretion protein [Neoroseomonas oryzicola]NKE20140.1 HlyD family secretion protein [Neoroseomonas oryzicola]